MKSRLKSSEILLVQLTTYMCAQHRLDIIDGLKSKLGKKKNTASVLPELKPESIFHLKVL